MGLGRHLTFKIVEMSTADEYFGGGHDFFAYYRFPFFCYFPLTAQPNFRELLCKFG